VRGGDSSCSLLDGSHVRTSVRPDLNCLNRQGAPRRPCLRVRARQTCSEKRRPFPSSWRCDMFAVGLLSVHNVSAATAMNKRRISRNTPFQPVMVHHRYHVGGCIVRTCFQLHCRRHFAAQADSNTDSTPSTASSANDFAELDDVINKMLACTSNEEVRTVLYILVVLGSRTELR
jgi:hypothetical protein